MNFTSFNRLNYQYQPNETTWMKILKINNMKESENLNKQYELLVQLAF